MPNDIFADMRAAGGSSASSSAPQIDARGLFTDMQSEGQKHLPWWDSAGRRLASGASWVGHQPLTRGIMTTLGTVGRAGTGAITGAMHHGPSGIIPGARHGVADPEGEGGRLTEIEQGFARGVNSLPNISDETRDRINSWPGPVRHTPNDPLRVEQTGLKKAVLDTVFGSGLDASTWVPGLDILSVGGRAAKAAKLGTNLGRAGRAAGRVAGRAVHNIPHVGPQITEAVQAIPQHIDNIKSDFSTAHKQLQYLTPTGLNVRRSRNAARRVQQNQRATQYNAALDQLTPQVNQLDEYMRAHGYNSRDLQHNMHGPQQPHVTQALQNINQVTDQTLWRLGTPSVRRSMLARGFTPTEADRALSPSNVIERDFGQGYLPEHTLISKEDRQNARASRDFSVSPKGVRRSPFNRAKGDPRTDSPLIDRLTDYFNSAAYLEPQRRMEQTLLDEFGLKPVQTARTQGRIEALKDRGLELTLRGTAAQKAQNAKRLDRYGKLLERQRAQAGENVSRQATHLRFDAPNTENTLKGVFRGENDAAQAAGRDVRVGGLDASAAFGKHGELLKPVDNTRQKLTMENQRARLRLMDQINSQVKRTGRTVGKRQQRDITRLTNAVDRGEQYTKNMAESRYNQMLRTEQSLKDVVKGNKSLSKDIEVGYGRDRSTIPGGIDVPKSQPKNMVLNKQGENLLRRFDPVMQRAESAADEGYIRSGLNPLRREISSAKRQNQSAIDRLTRRFNRDTERLGKATVTGEGIASRSSNANYNKLVDADLRLQNAIQQSPHLTDELEVGYTRDAGGIEVPRSANEVQKIENRSGRKLRYSLDPLYTHLLKQTGKSANERYFNPISKAIERSQSSQAQSLEDLVRHFKGEVGRLHRGANRTENLAMERAQKNLTSAERERSGLEKALKNNPHLADDIRAGDVRDKHGVLKRRGANEVQQVTNAAGDRILRQIDPLYNRILKDTTKERVGQGFKGVRHAIGTAGAETGSGKAAVDQLSRTFENAKGTGRIDSMRNRIVKYANKVAPRFARNDAVERVGQSLENDVLHKGAVPHMPEGLYEDLFGQKVRHDPTAWERYFSHPMTEALFANPVPHMSNIMQQHAFAGGGGVSGVARGLSRSAKAALGKGSARAEREQAREFGGVAPHGYHSAEGKTNVIARAHDAAQRALTSVHEGQATELFQRELRSGKSPEEAAAAALRVFGENETSSAAEAYRRGGVPFANWALSTVPRSAAAMVKNPSGRRAALAYARGVNSANEDYFEPNYGVDINPGGWLSRAAELGFSPARYAASGSLKTALQEDADDYNRSPGELAKSFMPFGGVADSFKAPLDPKTASKRHVKELPLGWRLASGLTGGYFTKAETKAQKRARMGYLRGQSKESIQMINRMLAGYNRF